VNASKPLPASAHDRVRVGSLEVDYHVAGAGAPVILVHGGGPGTTALSTFGPTFDMLARGFRAFAPDMPGWGESSAVVFDARVQLDTLVAFIDAMGVERAAFVGHSLGGARALDLAAAHPDRVSALVLIAAPAPEVAMGDAAGAIYEAYVEPTPDRTAAFLSAAFHDPSFATSELAERVSLSARAHPEHCANFLAAIASGRFSLFAGAAASSAIGTIAAPTLIIHGRDDRVVTDEAALRLSASITNSHLLLFDRCGHFPHVEHEREVTETITAFLQDTIESN
jgi:2-hydroxy-6-oxonona-2,4-dienedioate hydrolase